MKRRIRKNYSKRYRRMGMAKRRGKRLSKIMLASRGGIRL